MKILFPFVGDTIGGSHISAFTLFNCLKAQYPQIKFDVLVFTASDSFKNCALANNIQFHELGVVLKSYSKFGIIFDTLKTIILITKYLSKEDFDIVHTNDIRMHLIFLVASKFVSTKHLWHQRTSMPRSSFGQKVFLLCNKFIVISNFILKQIHIPVPPNKVSMIYNPVESYFASKKKLAAKKELFGKKKCKLAFVANMQGRKKPKFFLALAKYFTKVHPNKYQFIMMGRISSDISEIIDRYKKNGDLDDNFEVAGFKANMNIYWPDIDFLIAPAIEEGFGRTIVEAMRAGVISIAYNSGGHPEIIQHGYNGFLIDKLNLKLFSSKVFSIEKNLKNYMKILINGQKDATLHFSASEHTKKIVALYNEMIADR